MTGARRPPGTAAGPAAGAYEKFDRREDGFTKVLLHPANA